MSLLLPLTLLAFLLLFILTLSIYHIYTILYPYFFRGAPYVNSRPETVEKMVEMAKITSEDVVVDLGSGDGRLVIAAAKAGAKMAIGYEVYPRLVDQAKTSAKAQHVEKNTQFIQQSFWKANLQNTTVVFLFQIPFAMNNIERKLLAELPHGARVVSNFFRFKNWQALREEGGVVVYKKE